MSIVERLGFTESMVARTYTYKTPWKASLSMGF
jgi:hypothetical protein